MNWPMPAMLELHRPTQCLLSLGLAPSACPTCHPTSNAAWIVSPPVLGRQVRQGSQSIWGPVFAAHLWGNL